MTDHAVRPLGRSDRRDAAQGRRGFTLVELLVVIVIIGVLTSLVIGMAWRVTQGGKARLTQDIIRVLDQTLTEVKSQFEAIPPPAFVDDNGNEFPMIDARPASAGIDNGANPAEPSLTLYLLLASKAANVDAALKGLDARLIERKTITTSFGTPKLRNAAGTLVDATGLYIHDGYGNPIRFVHPAFGGGYGDYFSLGPNPPNAARGMVTRQVLSVAYRNGGSSLSMDFRRSYRPWNLDIPPAGLGDPVGDGDEGICLGGSPYFYSCGIDGDPGTRKDNLYTTAPQFPKETADFY